MKNLKTYEAFSIRDIFKKTKDNRKDFIESIMTLGDNYIEDCKIKVNDQTIYTRKNYKWSSITTGPWCAISFDKKLNTYKPGRKESLGDACIWFNLNFNVNDFIISILEKYSEITNVIISSNGYHPSGVTGYNIKNDDIPEIVKQLTIENCEEFLMSKKYNL